MNAETILIIFFLAFLITTGLVFGVWRYFQISWKTTAKIIAGIVLLITLFITFLTLTFLYGKRTVTAVEIQATTSFADSRGYKLEQYVKGRAKLTFWYSWRMRSEYSFPSHSHEPKVIEERWLANQTAIYLCLKVQPDDSDTHEAFYKIIYDFENGKMYATNGTGSWLLGVWSERRRGDLSLTPEDFQKILESYEKQGTANKSIDVRAKQRLSYQHISLNSTVRVAVSPHVISAVFREIY